MTNLTIGIDTFRVEVAGDATRAPLMLSHCLGADLSMWDGQMAPLIERFRVVRYDARGHGGSRSHDTPVSIADLGRDALAILDALEIERVHWIGLSLGGAVGLWLLAHAPDRIGRAILANTAPKVGTPDSWNTRIASVRADGMAETAAAMMERWFSASFTEREPARVAKIHNLVRNTSPQGYAACCASLRDMDLRESLHNFTNDVLVITGTDDPVVPPADAEAFIAAMPGARSVALAARHLSNIEAEADFNAAVIAFLTAKTARPKRNPMPRVEPTKSVAVKRGGAARRSNAARAPLKATAKKTTAQKTTAKKAAPKSAAGLTKKKPAAAHRRPTVAAAKTRRAGLKTVAKKRAAKTPRKATSTRRRTPLAAARATAKAPVRKTKPKTIAKTVKKVARKAPAKKPPAGRRKTTIKPRRPTGRGKR